MKRFFTAILLSAFIPALTGCGGSASKARLEKARQLGVDEARKVAEAHRRSDFATERAILHSRSILTLLNDEDVRLGDAYLEAFSGELETTDSLLLRSIIQQ